MENKLDTDRISLIQICSDCFILILQLRLSQNFEDPESLRHKIIEVLNNIERTAKREGFSMQDIQDVKFALVAFIDETLTAGDWQGKNQWMGFPLQTQLFNRFDAGEAFFQKLDELLDQLRLNKEVLKVYFLCLTLGYKGKYAFLEQEKLHIITDDLYKELRRNTSNGPSTLSPNGQRSEEATEIIETEVSFWTIGLSTGMIMLLIYLIFFVLSSASLP